MDAENPPILFFKYLNNFVYLFVCFSKEDIYIPMDSDNCLVKAKGGGGGEGGGGPRRGKRGTPAIMSTLKMLIKRNPPIVKINVYN